MILLKDADGILQELSAEMFEQMFGVRYITQLEFDASCPPCDLHESESQTAVETLPAENRRRFHERRVVHQTRRGAAEYGGKIKNWLYGELIKQGHSAKTYVAKVSEEVGYGLFAAEEVEKGKMIAEYTGLARASQPDDAKNIYLFHYLDNAVIDASEIGNVTRFINHATGKANANYVRVPVDAAQHVIMCAQKRIAKDEQILFDYGEGYWIERNIPQRLRAKSETI